jgi:hypothetical protein
VMHEPHDEAHASFVLTSPRGYPVGGLGLSGRAVLLMATDGGWALFPRSGGLAPTRDLAGALQLLYDYDSIAKNGDQQRPSSSSMTAPPCFRTTPTPPWSAARWTVVAACTRSNGSETPSRRPRWSSSVNSGASCQLCA